MEIFVGKHSVTGLSKLDDLTIAPAKDPGPDTQLKDGEILVRIEKFIINSNTITYAAAAPFPPAYYGQFFSQGASKHCFRVPTWGFATVEASKSEIVKRGERIMGLLPVGTYAVLIPGLAEATYPPKTYTWLECSPHRVRDDKAASWLYNTYRRVTDDPFLQVGGEELFLVFFSAFLTSWCIEDHLSRLKPACFGAETLVISSASAKTAFLLAYFAKKKTPDLNVIGISRRQNQAIVEGLGLYDQICTYETLEEFPRKKAVYIDFHGDPKLRSRVHHHFEVVGSLSVGATSSPSLLSLGGLLSFAFQGAKEYFSVLPGAPAEPWRVFHHIQTRADEAGETGAAALDAEVLSGWRLVVEQVLQPHPERCRIVRMENYEDTQNIFQRVVSGNIDPREGYICSMNDSSPSTSSAADASPAGTMFRSATVAGLSEEARPCVLQ